ncbi:FAD-binding oxidoreductase [Nocardia pneumoniae]|uniref:FAD-binding oxidoreductase n=1 Tax=Nocardia pneumoniae TaxID=228601 RepID=UPI0002E8C9A1|nr:FAD-binding oxidoreductase [Nocardia pneumoniae]
MTLRALRLPAAFRGQIIDAAHPDYDRTRRIWKGLDRRPALIAGCADVSDVRRVVEFAAGEGLPLAVVGAGHDVAARSMPDDALVASTAALDRIELDPENRRVRVGSGVRWGDLAAAADRFGLATTGASVATVGVAGFALHGGLGWLMRSYGTACDNIQSLEMVTADGRLRTVDADTEPDLFWAMRGAGSNFGAVTSLTLRLHPVRRVVAGVKLYPAGRARDVLNAYREITAGAGDEMVTHFYYSSNPDGSHSTGIGLCYNGPQDALDGLLAPLAPLGEPMHDSVRTMSAGELQAVHDSSTPPGARYHLRAHYFSELSDAAADVIVERCRSIDAPFTQVFLEHLGGAVGRVPAEATSFGGRDARYSFLVVNGWDAPDADAAQVEWTRAFGDAVARHAAPGAYVNYLDYDEDHRIPGAYGDAYSRLRSLKRIHDPANMFRFNRNIPPEVDR